MAFEIYGTEKRPVRGLLLDMDGVVLDTEKLYARFWAEAACALGYPMTYAQALGMRSLNAAAGQAKLESYFGPGVSRAVMRDKRVELMDAYVAEHGVTPKPGIYELLDAARAKGILTAIATSSPRERARQYLEPLGLLTRFDRICTAHEVSQGKPAPDIYLYAAGQLGLRPEDCLAVEDSPAGIESAFRAGCRAVMVPDLDRATEEMKKQLFAQADSLADMIKLLEEMQ